MLLASQFKSHSYRGEAKDNPLYVEPEIVSGEHTDQEQSTDENVNGTAL